MGDYNPYRPQILGQEWVPIRDENLELSPATNFIEAGHEFTLAASAVLQDGRYYTPGPTGIPADADRGQHMGIAIYPSGLEDQSGPIERVVIPVSSAICTGGNPTGDVTSRLLVPSGYLGGVSFNAGSAATMGIRMSFGVGKYPQLNGKRILGVNLLYVVQGTDDLVGPTSDGTGTLMSMTTEFDALPTVNYVPYDRMHSTPNDEIVRAPLGEINPFWTSTSPVSTADRMHWTYTQLLRFDQVSPAGARLFITMATGTNVFGGAPVGSSLVILYAALEVFYCEEQRVAFGAVQLGAGTVSLGQKSRVGANVIPLRTMAYASNPTLAAGRYTAVVTSPFVGGQDFLFVSSSDYPFLNAVRELYGLPTHPGVQVNIPFPLDDSAVGDTLSVETIHVLPQLSLHASGGTLTEPHAYGRQVAAEVWGVNTVTQELYDDVLPAATVFQQVRYVARRFGDTTVPLTLTGTASLAGSSVSITVAEFDALTEIIDGWKEVTLRFTVPPTMGTLATPEPSWTWSAASETAGNRWEILGACAPAVSGVAGNLFNLVTPIHQLYSATYQPPAGAQAELTWMPQGVGSPYVTGASEDDSSDAFLIFSQDPPTVTGVGLTAHTQTVTGIGFMCGQLPCCIPSGISYQRITWSPTSMPVSAFGAYEMQRFDTTPGASFETIMLATSPYVTGFNDYEARVGVNSVYRLRTLNIYNFAGAWSAQVTGAPPTPGVTGGCSDQTGALIFTSNADQSGASNAAYVMQWDSEPVEDFALPEADQVVFQALYGRDGVVAFHGTERGLEEFSRALLIQAAAIDPIRLADVKTLRDLAWADLPYICVRDDAGDRWFANVQVPTVNARLNRTVYMARIDIRELTRTPYAVDP